MILARKYILLILLTLLAGSATPALGEKGDADGNGYVDLGDLILSLQVAAHIQTSPSPDKTGDVDGDGRIGLKEAMYVLQQISGARLYITIDFDHLPGGTPIQDGAVISDAYAQYGVSFQGAGLYADGDVPPPLEIDPDHNAYAYRELAYAQSKPHVIGARTVIGNEHWLSFGKLTVVATFVHAVDTLSIYGTGDPFEVDAYDEQDQLIDTFSSPSPGLPAEGFVLEISPEDTQGRRIGRIEFGGLSGQETYFDDLTLQRD